MYPIVSQGVASMVPRSDFRAPTAAISGAHLELFRPIWNPGGWSLMSCIVLEQSAGVGPVVSVVASFPQQTENRTFCLVLQSWLTTSHCTDYYYVTSVFRLIVTCPCSLRTWRHAKVNSSFIIIIIIIVCTCYTQSLAFKVLTMTPYLDDNNWQMAFIFGVLDPTLGLHPRTPR